MVRTPIESNPFSQNDLAEQVFALQNELLAYAVRMLKNREDAEDVVAELMVTMLSRAETEPEILNLRAYCYRAVKNICLNRIKVGTRHSRLLLQKHPEWVEGTTDDALVQLERAEARARVALCIEELSLGHRDVVQMFYLDEVPYAEMENKLSLKPGTVKSRLFRAREALKSKLTKTGMKL